MDSQTQNVGLDDKSPQQSLEDQSSQKIPGTRLKTPVVVEEGLQPKEDLRRTRSLNDDWKQRTGDERVFLAPKMQTQLSLDAHLQKRFNDLNKGKWQRRQFSHSKKRVMSLDDGERSPESLEMEEEISQKDQGAKQRLTVSGIKRSISLAKGGHDKDDEGDDDDWEPFSPAGVEWKALSRDDLWDPLELGNMWKTILPEEKQWRPLLEDHEEHGDEEDEHWHPFPVDEEWDPFVLKERLEKYKAQRSPESPDRASMLSEYDEEQTYAAEPGERAQAEEMVPPPGQGASEQSLSEDPKTLTPTESLPVTSKQQDQGSVEDALERRSAPCQEQVDLFPEDLMQPKTSGENHKPPMGLEDKTSSNSNPDQVEAVSYQKQVDPFPEHLIKPKLSGVNMHKTAGDEALHVSSSNQGPAEVGLTALSACQKHDDSFPEHLIRPQKATRGNLPPVTKDEDLSASSSDQGLHEKPTFCQKQVEPFPEHLIKPQPSGGNLQSVEGEDDDLIHTLRSDDGYVSRPAAASGTDLSESDMSSGDTLKSDLSSFLEDAEEELSCLVCFELLMDPHTPKNLECAHVCCALCLQGLLQKSPKVECPQCRHMTTVADSKVSSLKTNLRLRNLAEIYHKHSQGAPDQNLGQCSEHGDRLRYYCQTCNIVACGTCVCDSHPKTTHDVRDLQDVYTEQKSEISVVIEMTSKRSQENFNSLSNLKAAVAGFQNLLALEEETIDKETQQMIAKIKKAADAKKTVIRKGRQAQLEAMDKQKQKLEMHQVEIQRAIAKAKHEVDKSKEWDYVTKHNKMVADITALLEQFKTFGHS